MTFRQMLSSLPSILQGEYIIESGGDAVGGGKAGGDTFIVRSFVHLAKQGIWL